MVCGGGKLPETVRDRFVELAGGGDAKIVVIPTAHTYADRPEAQRLLEPWTARKVASAKLLHARSRQEADDAAFVRPLAEATGVWISGGVQARLTGMYLGTEVERQLKGVLARGGVIGGTSAGAAVMSRVMIVSGRTEATLGEGFDLLPGTVIDQHLLRRNRMERLLGVVRKHPDLIGLGVDEETALVVDVKARRLSVLGERYAFACVPEAAEPDPAPAPEPRAGGPAIDPDPTREPRPAKAPAPGRVTVRPEILNPGDEADLGALRSGRPGAVVSAIDFDAL
jgi:cyanophycinase